MGVVLCGLQSCSSDDEDKIDDTNIENNDGNKKETLTLYKLWYLTDYSNYSDFDWQTDNVVSWQEYMEFSEETLYWNSRMGGENTTYITNGTISYCVSYSFTAVNINNSDDKRIITVKEMTEKYLLLYDHEEELYRGFVSSYFTNLTGGGNGGSSDNEDSGSSGGNDNSDSDDNEEEEEGEWRDCPSCNGTGVCYNCDGDGLGAYIYGTDKREDCKTCKGYGVCPKCDGKGKYWRE